jgi:hypothetical protein
MKTRRHLRSARVSALSQEERLQELREAEARIAVGEDGAAPAVHDPDDGQASAPQTNSPDAR